VLRVRPAIATDADALAETVAEGFASYRSFAPPQWSPPDRLELAIGIAIRLRDADQQTWVAVDDDDTIAGQVAYLPAGRSRHPIHDPALAHVGQLFVRRTHWGTGLAGQLLDLAVADATEREFTAMRLFTPADHGRARRFYEREGWSLTGDPIDEQPLGLLLVEYRRTLNHPPKGVRPR
jgi:GNAT superfamily N-acetyltransferase